MDNLFSVLTLLLVSLSTTLGGLGKCPPMSGMSDFQPVGHLGRWYEFARAKPLYKLFERCSYYDICFQRDELFSSVYTYYIFDERSTENWLTSFQNSNMPNSKYALTPVMIDTDYDNYAVIYNCHENAFGLSHTPLAYILTRERFPNQAVIKTAYDALKNINMEDSVKEIDQNNCPSVLD